MSPTNLLGERSSVWAACQPGTLATKHRRDLRGLVPRLTRGRIHASSCPRDGVRAAGYEQQTGRARPCTRWLAACRARRPSPGALRFAAARPAHDRPCDRLDSTASSSAPMRRTHKPGRVLRRLLPGPAGPPARRVRPTVRRGPSDLLSGRRGEGRRREPDHRIAGLGLEPRLLRQCSEAGVVVAPLPAGVLDPRVLARSRGLPRAAAP